MTISTSGNFHVCLVGSTDNTDHKLRTRYQIRLEVMKKRCKMLSIPVPFSLAGWHKKAGK